MSISSKSISSKPRLWQQAWMLPASPLQTDSRLLDILEKLHAFPGEPSARSVENMRGLLKDLTEIQQGLDPALVGVAWVLCSRHFLRAGCWELLDLASRHLMGAVRCLPPCKLQGIAAGLMAEWALASGNGKVAMVYARESLGSRSEVQRIRGYLALAHAVIGDRDGSIVQTLCAYEATQQQADLAGRSDFAKLQQLRVRLLLDLPPEAITDFADPDVRAMATMALWLRDPTVVFSQALGEAIDRLWRSGRARDILLLRDVLPAEHMPNVVKAERFRESFDSLREGLPPPPAYPITDGEALETLPSSLAHLPPQTLWCCI